MKKKNLFIALSAVALLGIGTTACSSSSSNNSAKNSKTSTISQNKDLRNKYDKIQVGELSNHGEGGYTVKQVEDLLGKPTSTSETTVTNYKVKDEIWNKGEVTITIQTESDKVVSKDITGFKWTGRPAKLTLAAYNSLQDGASYDDVVKQYGEPDSLNESLLLGKKTQTATWLTGVKGKSGANATLTFENGQLTSKVQSDLS